MTIILENISKSYDGKKVIDNLNVEIEDGKSYAFVGPKDSGKTTALKIFMGLEKPDQGKVSRMGDYKYPTLQSAYVSQAGQLNPKKNAIWNVKKAHRWASKGRAIEELNRFLPEDRQEIPVSELNEVEKRLVEIVRAFFVPADFIVLDEPFEGMDDNLRLKVLQHIMNIKGTRPLLIASRSEDGLDFARKIRMFQN
ncbi:NitT/TauT family transport system ATP-binding protein [Pseudobutyrivibrio sp. YE44]|uniref:ATP-binding cassette domain-containing protein n=1 Tax=Pseudobutyrivibrio sp. YE44 TaxID=1520802 RepID=UPI00088DAC69|nr:ATP-binding cassette domain-containing protein [Pseudobutyrivibrio sp. YE44]SDB33964.1 NitT/TauT family transport system ATP-binding protein [Pseudobutyrivibrio sp. YE44]